MALMRLDKLLTESGAASRRDAKLLIKQGLVAVDGVPCREPERKVDPATQCVSLRGETLRAGARYFILNKPIGVVTATEDRDEKTVVDILPQELKKLGLLPVGRLDKDTSGLLIMTNDGEYIHRVISPRSGVEKCYVAELARPLTGMEAERFAAGVELSDGTKCLPGKLEPLGERCCRVTICEGKYHQVRRMLAACGNHVTALHRESIGSLTLGELSPGEIRELGGGEEQLVFKAGEV
jgi:16S rRNA pseudouridine516 synthase